MNSSSRPWPFGEPHGCASNLDTWPLHHAYRRGERCRLCSSCILLSDRSVYCCCFFLLITSPSFHYDDGDPLMAPPGPTVTCQDCRSAVAHLACLYELFPAGYGVFVCPACSAAEEGRPFTYAPPCRQPLDARAARVLLLGARMALALLQREAAEAERLAREAGEARRRAYRALREALGVDTQEAAWYFNADDQPPLVPTQAPENNRPAAALEQGGETNIVDAPQPHEDNLAASGEGSQANVKDAPLVHRYAMPPLAGLTIGTGWGCATAVAMAPAESSDTPPWSSWSLPPFGANEVTKTAAESSNSSRACPAPPRTLDLFGVREMAMAAAEAARASPPAPRTLQLLPADEGSASPKMHRTLKLFEDKIPDDDEEMQRCWGSSLMSSD
ncbi:uncharacterized protein C2845_PM07G07440 [Panicum miliaceum]|uniref:Uncharacterized protein n=1 Tax=Panicum miliaceum TaxID=4540 RepID=A0A3L6SJE1_PANMI|nr:uncharacterized protein C2845_PM07G07440 [Panicum miliaceum]